jgi:hypothetical protein
MSGTHPTLYRVLDEVIGLADCEVFSYSPDIDSDPHANDSDDEDDVASVADEDSSDEPDDEFAFEFDDYGVDESFPDPSSSRPASMFLRQRIPFRNNSGSTSSGDSPERHTFAHVRLKRRCGALLWSSHWFFLNPKLKRILFISVWAHTKNAHRRWDNEEWSGMVMDDEGYSGAGSAPKEERFFGWEGDIGAGARAMGLSASA